MARALLKVRVRGRRMASDIRAGRRFPLQNLAGRLPYALLLRPMIRQGIANNKEAMKGKIDQLLPAIKERARENNRIAVNLLTKKVDGVPVCAPFKGEKE